MSKTFRPWKIDQPLLLPASVPDFVGKDLLARAASNRESPPPRRPTYPIPKRRRTSSIPKSRIMKTKDGFIQGYNAHAAVDATAQVHGGPATHG